MSYQWAFGDGRMATGITATHTYEAPGDYTVRLTVVDSHDREAQSHRTIKVGTLEFFDDFTVAPDPRWDTRDGNWTVVEGRFTALHAQGWTWHTASLPLGHFADYVIDVDVELGLGTTGAVVYGRRTADRNVHVYLYGYNDRLHTVTVFAGRETIASRSMSASGSVSVRVEVTGGRYRFYVNNVRISDFVDPEYRAYERTVLGLALHYYRYSAGPGRVSFDNFKVDSFGG